MAVSCVKPPIIYGDISRPKAMTDRMDNLRSKSYKKDYERYAYGTGYNIKLEFC